MRQKIIKWVSFATILSLYVLVMNSCSTPNGERKVSNGDKDVVKSKQKMMMKDETDLGGFSW